MPGSPKASTSGVVSSGPSAKPAFPPTENMLIPRPRLVPAAKFAKRAASGWKAATPSPLSAIATAVAA